MPTAEGNAARALDAHSRAVAEAVVERQFKANPELAARYGEAGKSHCLKDAQYHLSYLAEALQYGAEDMFCDYMAWAKSMLTVRGIPLDDLVENLKHLKNTIGNTLPVEQASAVYPYLDAALRRVKDVSLESPSFIVPGNQAGDLSHIYIEALLQGKRHLASKLVLEAADNGVSVADIYLKVFQPAQYEIGRLWQLNQITVAQEHYCTAATQLIMSQLYPRLFAGAKSKGHMVATCVGGDLHELGIRMVADFFELDGWHTFYLGANTPTAGVIQTMIQQRADLVAISATMTFHVRATERLIAAIRSTAQLARARILVGGYPFNRVPGLWQRVGADGSAGNAQNAVSIGNDLMTD